MGEEVDLEGALRRALQALQLARLDLMTEDWRRVERRIETAIYFINDAQDLAGLLRRQLPGGEASGL